MSQSSDNSTPMDAEGNHQRRSARANKGVPPPRFPNPEEPRLPVTKMRSSVAKSKSVKSNSTVRKLEIEMETEQELLEIQQKLTEKETELELAEAKFKSLEKKLDRLKNGQVSGNQDDLRQQGNDLIRAQMEAEDKVQVLKIQLKGLRITSEGKKRLVQQKKNLQLEELLEEGRQSSDSEEEKNKQERVQDWVQNVNAQSTPLFRVYADATNSKVLPKPLEVISNNGSSEVNHGQAGTRITDKPIYVHQQQQKKTGTQSYSNSSDEELARHFEKKSLPAENEQVTMRDLVNALSQFGANHRQPEVIMKTTVDKDLPKFGGEPEEWIPFKSEFDRTSKKYKFDESENMIRLRKALTGPARSTVQHLMANVANVPLIIDSLEKRFGRPRVVLNVLASKAMSCQSVTTAKPESIVEFGLAVQALVANVVSYNEEGYISSVELLDALVKKLSPDLATRWYEWLASDKIRKHNLLGFSEWSSLQLEIAYQRVDFKFEEKTEDDSRGRRRRGPGTINVTKTEDDKCSCCGKTGHRLEKCFSFQNKSIDDRWKIVKRVNYCICCLKPGHRAKDCEKNRKCNLNGCDKVHHRLLHYDKTTQREQRTQEPQATANAEAVPQEGELVGNIAVITGCDGPLPIVPIKLRGPKGIVRCYGLLDNAASRSLMEKDLSEELGLVGESFDYSYSGVTGSTTERDAKKVNCEVAVVQRGGLFKKLRSVVTVQRIQINPYSIDMDEVKRKWPYLKSVPASSFINVKPRVIIGNNNPHLILARKIIQRRDDEPVGWRTELGWTVSGIFDSTGTGSVSLLSGDMPISNVKLHKLIKTSFSFEDFGVKIPKLKGQNLDEKRSYQILESTTSLVGEPGLLWRTDNVKFPESESAALKRLDYVERKMKIPDFKKPYNDKIQEYLSKGYLQRLSPAEAEVRFSKTYIIPHFGITNPNKPGKFRFILDAKAKSHGVSLNDMLLKGPDLIRSLVGLLWNFRRHQIALTGDIADWFHRIKVRDEDMDSQRLLWRDGDSSRKPDQYVLMVLMFGGTSSPCSAIFVKEKNAERFQEKYPHAVHVIKFDFFFDDCLTGGDTVEEVVQLRQQLTEISEAGNFNLCKWLSNSKEVLSSIPADLRADGVKNFEDKEDLPGERVLGMWWDPKDDVFQFKLGLHKVKPHILGGAVPTKREMCGVIMSLFDPIGFICHYKKKGLILLQEVWSHGIGWDDEIPVTTYMKWKVWLSRLDELKSVRIPRCYWNLGSALDIQIHTFVDASSEAYSCVCYLRLEHHGNVEVSFVSAKSRVAPLKKSTIPRLELQAALLGARLVASIMEELKLTVSRRYYWSDSSTVLLWLRSRAGKMKEFVANRIGEIQETTNPEEWHWIPTKMNIADVATRFESEISFEPDSEWFHGPAFLRGNPTHWNFAEERKKLNTMGSVSTAVGTSEDNSGSSLCSVQLGKVEQGGGGLFILHEITPCSERFSSYFRLVRATAAVKRAATYWLSKLRKDVEEAPWCLIADENRCPVLRRRFHSNISPDDIEMAEKQIGKIAQQDEFGKEINILRNGGQLRRKGNLWRLSPFIDEDGLWRVHGYIGAANVVADQKTPIIVLPRNRITELLPRNCWSSGYISASPGNVGHARVADVTTRDSVTKRKSEYSRPLAKVLSTRLGNGNRGTGSPSIWGPECRRVKKLLSPSEHAARQKYILFCSHRV